MIASTVSSGLYRLANLNILRKLICSQVKDAHNCAAKGQIKQRATFAEIISVK